MKSMRLKFILNQLEIQMNKGSLWSRIKGLKEKKEKTNKKHYQSLLTRSNESLKPFLNNIKY